MGSDNTLYSVAEGTVLFKGRMVHVNPTDKKALRPAWLLA
jgi:ribosomal protein L27